MDVHPYDDPLPGPGEHNPCFEQIAAFRCSDSALGLCLWLTWLPWQPNCHGPLEMARWKVGKTQMTWIINESKWPKMKGLLAVSESWWTHSQLLQLSRLCRKSSWQDAMECRMPRKNRIFDKKKWQAWPSCSSSRYIQPHFLNFPLVTNGTWHTKGIHSPALYLASTRVKTLFGATIKQKYVWYIYLLITYVCIYIYIHTRFFWILLMTVGIVRCSTFYRLDAKDGCLTWEWNFRWMPVIVLTPHVQTSMKGKWVQKLRCMPCCATGVWRYVLM